MKSARRHELQTNELADLLGRWVNQAQPYAMPALIIVAAALVGCGLFMWYSSSVKRTTGEAWRSFFLAMSGQDTEQIQAGLENVATNYGDSAAALWALVVAGDVDLNDGLDSLFQDKSVALTSLGNAIEKYEEVLKQLGDGTDQPLLRQRALFGLAQAKEGLGEVDEAAEYYQKAAEVNGADSALAEQAKQRAKALADSDLKNWYFWFKRQEPKPPSAQRPASNLPGTLPGLDSLSDFPDLGTPSGESKPPAGEKKSGADSTKQPETKKSEEKEPQKKPAGDQGNATKAAGKSEGATSTPESPKKGDASSSAPSDSKGQ